MIDPHGRRRRDDRRTFRPLAIVALASLAVLVGATALVANGTTGTADVAATVALQSVASPALDLVANANTPLGQPTITPFIAAGLALILWRTGPRGAWLAAGAFAIPILVGLVLKLLFVHPPPPPEFVRTSFNPLGIRFETAGAFPSGHIARVTFLGVLAWGVFRAAWQRWLIVVLLVWTFWARIYLGDHWLSDAVGGLALGIASGCVALAWLRWRRARAVHP